MTKKPELQKIEKRVKGGEDITLKNKVRALRFRNNLTQLELSELSGISPTNVWLMENERVAVTIGTMRRVAKVFNKRVEEIFDINEEWEDEDLKNIY